MAKMVESTERIFGVIKMSTYWRSVNNKCIICNESVGKMSIKEGKIIVDEYYDNWGCWKKIPNRSDMQVMCCVCQKKINKEERKRKTLEELKARKQTT